MKPNAIWLMICWWRKICFCQFVSLEKNFAIWSKKCQGVKTLSRGNFQLALRSVSTVLIWLKKLIENSIRQLCRSIDIVYKPVSVINQIINCSVAVSMRNTYRVVSNKTKNSLSITTTDQCYGCNKFFIEKKSLERYMNVCGYFPGIIYKFENQNIQTFSGNIKFIRDLPFSTYFDLETTTGKEV